MTGGKGRARYFDEEDELPGYLLNDGLAREGSALSLERNKNKTWTLFECSKVYKAEPVFTGGAEAVLSRLTDHGVELEADVALELNLPSSYELYWQIALELLPGNYLGSQQVQNYNSWEVAYSALDNGDGTWSIFKVCEPASDYTERPEVEEEGTYSAEDVFDVLDGLGFNILNLGELENKNSPGQGPNEAGDDEDDLDVVAAERVLENPVGVSHEDANFKVESPLPSVADEKVNRRALDAMIESEVFNRCPHNLEIHATRATGTPGKVRESVYRCRHCKKVFKGESFIEGESYESYTTDIAAAIRLLERLEAKGFVWTITNKEEGGQGRHLRLGFRPPPFLSKHVYVEASGETIGMAICLAVKVMLEEHKDFWARRMGGKRTKPARHPRGQSPVS